MPWSFAKQSNGKMTNLNVNILCTKKNVNIQNISNIFLIDNAQISFFLIDKWWLAESEITLSEVKKYIV